MDEADIVVQSRKDDSSKENTQDDFLQEKGDCEKEGTTLQESNLKQEDNGVDYEASATGKDALNSRTGIERSIREQYEEMRKNMVPARGLRRQPRKLGALFVDFENIYLSLRDLVAKPLEMTIHVLTRLRDKLQKEMAVNMVMGRAYASWEYGASRDALSHLSLLGIVPQYVLSRPQKSSADLKLSIDLMEVLLTRDDIHSFIIAGGDRDYMPIVEKIKERAKEIIIVSPGQATSGDLIALVGDYSFIDATLMLPRDVGPASHVFQGVPIPVKSREETGTPSVVLAKGSVTADNMMADKNGDGDETGSQDCIQPVVPVDSGETVESAGGDVLVKEGTAMIELGTADNAGFGQPGIIGTPTGSSKAETFSHSEESILEIREKQHVVIVDPKDEIIAEKSLREHMHEFSIQDLWRCVGLIIRAQGEIRNSEIWVGPFLKNYMNEEFDFMNNTQRKRLLALMEEVGAVEVNEKMDRMGEQTYSVLTVKWESPIIKAGLLRTKTAAEQPELPAENNIM